MDEMSIDPDIAKWQQWFRIIEPHIFQLQYSKVLFWKYAEIIKSDENLRKSFFTDWLSRVYTSHTVLGIRRLIDTSTKYPSISLVKLLMDIKLKPDLLTRKDYIKAQIHEMAPNDPLRRFFRKRDISKANEEFKKNFGPGKHLDVACVESDLLSMTDNPVFMKVKTFVDKFHAHTDENQAQHPIPQYSDTNLCIDVLTRIFSKYNKLVTGYVIIMDHFLEEIEEEIIDIFHKQAET